MELTIQFSAVLLIIAGAAGYLGIRVWRSKRKFEPRAGCDPGCGCGTNE